MNGSLLVLLLFIGVFSVKSEETSSRVDLSDIAKEVMSRAGGASQVLSLNLTNLIILLVLKGLLFGATYYGHGHGGYGYGGHGFKSRSLNGAEEPYITESEIMLMTSYLLGDAQKDFSCFHRVACQEPHKSKQYLQAAKILLKTSKIFSNVVGYDEKYENLVGGLQEAVDFGVKYGTCDRKYSCHNKNE